MGGAPLLELRGVRVDAHGKAVVDGVSFATTEARALVLGAPRALAEVAAGVERPAHGEVLVRGEPAHEALAAGRVAWAAVDAPMPPRWRVREYVAWSARLAGRSRAEAATLAGAAMTELGLASSADVLLGRAPPVVRRATALAAAIATGAETLVAHDPLDALDDDGARTLGRVLARALAERSWVLFAGRMPLSSPLALRADEAIVLDGAALHAQGAPAEIAARDKSFALRVVGDVAAFARMITARGATLSGAPDSRAAARYTIELGALTTADLFAIAEEAQVVVVQLAPVARAFQ